MTFNKIVNSIIIAVAAVFLVTLAFFVNVKGEVDSIAVLKTTGMTCGSCSSKITKALEALKGVAVTEVDVAGGWVLVGYDTKNIKPETLAEKVSSNGFGSNVYQVLTPGQFKQITGREIGTKAGQNPGCCGGKGGGCGSEKRS